MTPHRLTIREKTFRKYGETLTWSERGVVENSDFGYTIIRKRHPIMVGDVNRPDLSAKFAGIMVVPDIAMCVFHLPQSALGAVCDYEIERRNMGMDLGMTLNRFIPKAVQILVPSDPSSDTRVVCTGDLSGIKVENIYFFTTTTRNSRQLDHYRIVATSSFWNPLPSALSLQRVFAWFGSFFR